MQRRTVEFCGPVASGLTGEEHPPLVSALDNTRIDQLGPCRARGGITRIEDLYLSSQNGLFRSERFLLYLTTEIPVAIRNISTAARRTPLVRFGRSWSDGSIVQVL